MIAVALGVTLLLLGGCTSGSPPRPTPTTSAVPQIFEQACQLEGSSVCSAVTSGSVPAKLIRPMHFPPIAGGRCPTSPVRYLSTPDFGSMAFGRGLVRVGDDDAIAHGTVFPSAASSPGWLALKTHFVSVPGYQGPILVRAKRLDRSGPVSLGAAAEAALYIMPPGPANDLHGDWREVPYPTFIKAPGCYGWQVDGLTFSEVIIALVGHEFHFHPGG